MDKGRPFRAPQPNERRVVSRPAQTSRQVDDLAVDDPAPKTPPRSTAPAREHKQTKSKKRFVLTLIGIVIAAVLGFMAWSVWSGAHNGGAAIEKDKYQAVFFTNGQVYFGKLQMMKGSYMRLTDIYYLQNQQSATDTGSDNPQAASNGQGDVQLIKLGDEIHGPEDEMIISKDQVLFYENLKSDGRVSKSISEHKSSN